VRGRQARAIRYSWTHLPLLLVLLPCLFVPCWLSLRRALSPQCFCFSLSPLLPVAASSAVRTPPPLSSSVLPVHPTPKATGGVGGPVRSVRRVALAP
jgi:hypothetical protein